MMKQVVVERNSGNIYVGDAPEYRVDSVVNELLKQLASKPFQFQRISRKAPASTIAKIQHNHITTQKYIIKQYLDHSASIEAAYAGIDAIIPFGKQIILTSLNDLYFEALDAVGIDYLDGEIEIDAVRENSDFILGFVIRRLKNSAFESKNILSHKEPIESGINVVVAHAFIECVIFETPP
jgi:hypothetical protein